MIPGQTPLQMYEGRLQGLKTDRYSWWVHWAELATFILPRRYKWLMTPNQSNRGSAINQAILDNTATMAAGTLASGMMSGVTSPTRPWYRLRIEGYDTDTTNPVNLWLEEVQRRMMKVMQESNFYNALATMWLDLVVFGTAVVLIYEDFEDVIRCFNPCAGEYFLANSARMQVDTLYREFVLTIEQTVQRFGIENVSDAVRESYNQGAGAQQMEIKIGHALEPNTGGNMGVSKTFAFRECYWEIGNERAKNYLSIKGFHEFIALCPRWDLIGNDAYGRSPGMDILGDTKQLQQETKRKSQAIDKMVNPPLIADMQLKNQPSSAIPGGITYVSGMNNSANAGMRPIYQVMPQLADMAEDIREVQERIRLGMRNDLFLMISQLDTVRTATEIDARREEKLVLLGPVLERSQNEACDPAVRRVYNVMLRAQLLPPPPPELQGKVIEIEYSSMLAEAQRAVAATGIERMMATAGNFVGVQPDIMDNLDTDECIDEIASLLNVPPRLVRSRVNLDEIRSARAQKEASASALAGVNELAAAGKTLSETDVGGGQNALSAIYQGSPLPGVSPI